MNINWTLWIPIIAALIIQVFGVSLQEILTRAREKPKTKALAQDSAHTGVAKRLLYFLFPPDARSLFMLITAFAALMLTLHVESTQPLTRIAVFQIALWVGVSVVVLMMSVAVGMYKELEKSKTIEQLNAAKGDPLSFDAPANNALEGTAGSEPVMRRVPAKVRPTRRRPSA